MQRAWDRALSVIPLWQRVRTHPLFRAAVGFEETLWTRRVSEVEMRRLVVALDPGRLSALEISGDHWSGTGFRAYRWPHARLADQWIQGPEIALFEAAFAARAGLPSSHAIAACTDGWPSTTS